jgi:hypothetical protein
MDDLLVIIYSHTDFIDVLVPSIGRLNKYFPSCKYAVCINNKAFLLDNFPQINFGDIYEYDDSLAWNSKVMSVLERIPNEYILFNLDKNILHSPVKVDILADILQKVKDEGIDYVIFDNKSHNLPLYGSSSKYYFGPKPPNCGSYYFSVNGGLFKRKSLLDIYTKFKDLTYNNNEGQEVQNYTSANYKVYITSDSEIDPTIIWATIVPFFPATTARKWWTNLYQKNKEYIMELFTEYGIDGNKRGYI